MVPIAFDQHLWAERVGELHAGTSIDLASGWSDGGITEPLVGDVTGATRAWDEAVESAMSMAESARTWAKADRLNEQRPVPQGGAHQCACGRARLRGFASGAAHAAAARVLGLLAQSRYLCSPRAQPFYMRDAGLRLVLARCSCW